MIDKFMKICNEYPVNYEGLKELLNNGLDINSEVDNQIDGKSVLANITMGWPNHDLEDDVNLGEAFYELVKFFVNNGFDVKKYGGECLNALCWSYAGKYVLHIAELLLDHGADTSAKFDPNDGKGVLDTIEWKLGDWVVSDGRTANLMTAYYEMVEAYEKGEDYHRIRAFESCIGSKITKIEKVAFSEAEVSFDEKLRNAFSGGIIIWCDNMPLFLSKYGELYVDPRVVDKAVLITDITEHYKALAGLIIKDLKYIDGNQGIGLISFDDSDIELLFNSVFRGKEKARYVFINVIDYTSSCNIDLSNIKEILLSSGRSYSSYVKEYDEKYVVIRCENTSYLLYSDGEYYEKHGLRIINVRKWFSHGKYRRMHIKEPCLSDYILHSDKTIKAIVFDTLDRQLVFATDIFDEMKIVFVDKYLDAIVNKKYENGQYNLHFEEIEME